MHQDNHQVVILGGGIAGITAALELARSGLEVALLEKSPFFGGQAVHFGCKATQVCQKCGACLVDQRLRDLFREPRITLYPHTEFTGCRRDNGLLQLALASRPGCIDPVRCIDCGICYDECPAIAQRAIITIPSGVQHPRYAINPAGCLYFRDGSCRVCEQLCFPQAIDLDRPERRLSLTTPALVLATGYQPADPRSRPHYLYGHVSQVITGRDLEEKLREGGPLLRPDGTPVRRVAFVQCVGSRDTAHPYCSRVCCAYGLRMARLLKHREPECEVITFYMDLQNIGRDSQAFQEEACQAVKIVRSLPGNIAPSPAGGINLRFVDDISGKVQDTQADLLVLAVGISPGPDNSRLAELLHLELTGEGFFQAREAGSHTATNQTGIFLAGTAAGPMSIGESISQATAAARQVVEFLNTAHSGATQTIVALTPSPESRIPK